MARGGGLVDKEGVTVAETIEVGAERKGLEKKALSATLWTVADYGAAQSLRVVNSLVLTRLLLPAAFGQVTLVATMIVGITLLSDIGLAPSIIQSRRGDEPAFLNTAFTLQAARGAGLWVIAALMAWPMAAFYGDRTLLAVLPVLALGMLIEGLMSTNYLTLSRHLGVRRLFLIDFSSQVVALVVTVGWAMWRPSVWALVMGSVISKTYKVGLTHFGPVVPGIRNKFFWEERSAKEIFGFGKWIVVGTGFYFFATQSDRLILGKLTTLTMLGIYGIAFNLSDIPRSVIQAFSYKVGYPFVAKIVHLPREEFREQFLRYRGYTLVVGGVLLSFMVIWGDLLMKLYDKRYAAGAWMIPILAVGLWHTLMYMTTSPVLLSLGKSRYNAIGNAGYCVAMVVGILVGFHVWGVKGAVWAVAGGDLPLYFVTQWGAVREGVRPLKQDAVMTLGFVALLAGEWALRHAMR